MSSVTNIYGTGYNNSLFLGAGTNAGNELLEKAKKQQEARGKGQGAYSKNNTREQGMAALRRALEEMRGVVDPPFTGAKIREFQTALEETFSVKVRLDLMKLGVSEDTEFTITQTPEGFLQVGCDDKAAKAVIEEYLEKNPKVCDNFGYIQALANYEKARQNPATAGWADMRNLKAEIQLSAVEQFFGAALDSFAGYAPLTAGFEPEAPVRFYSGLDFTV